MEEELVKHIKEESSEPLKVVKPKFVFYINIPKILFGGIFMSVMIFIFGYLFLYFILSLFGINLPLYRNYTVDEIRIILIVVGIIYLIIYIFICIYKILNIIKREYDLMNDKIIFKYGVFHKKSIEVYYKDIFRVNIVKSRNVKKLFKIF